jgi:23S rRNA pseudouridine2605 synthase
MGYRDEDRPKRSARSNSNDGSPRTPRDGERRGRPQSDRGDTQGRPASRFGGAERGRTADGVRGSERGRGDERSGGRGYSRGDERPARGEKPERSRGSYDPNKPEWANSRRPENPERKRSPLIPDEITDKDVEIGVRAQLKTLTPENAEKVARHLAMVSLLIDQDPELAHEHALAAADRAGRIAMVRETVGCTAYAIGDFALALRELLTHRRISGSNEQIALIVDSERGLGRPERALEVGRSVDRATLSPQARVNLAIAMSGARLDRKEFELALAELEIPELNPAKVFEYSPALFFAYADVLEDLGREKDSKRWADLGNRAVKALSGSNEDEDETIVILEEIEIPVRREWVEESEWQARQAEGRAPRGEGRARRGEARPERKPWGERGDRPTRGDREERPERKPWGERGDRPARGGDRPARGDREGRPARGDRPQSDRPRSSGPRVNRDEYRPKRDK